eukprot:GHVU01185164.1.p1 GENE.GHVU01185164.1~~GHVU01185164.1.p1  ORF type:complete len:205 (+),score=11.56 GHVU01185164.1:1511-2125(+)
MASNNGENSSTADRPYQGLYSESDQGVQGAAPQEYRSLENIEMQELSGCDKDGYLPPLSGSDNDGYLPPLSGSDNDGYLPPLSGSDNDGYLPPLSGSDNDGYLPPLSREPGHDYLDLTSGNSSEPYEITPYAIGRESLIDDENIYYEADAGGVSQETRPLPAIPSDYEPAPSARLGCKVLIATAVVLVLCGVISGVVLLFVKGK